MVKLGRGYSHVYLAGVVFCLIISHLMVVKLVFRRWVGCCVVFCSFYCFTC